MTNRKSMNSLPTIELAKKIKELSGKSINEIASWLKQPADASETHDPVNHPDHYTQAGIDCIDIMLALFGKEAVKGFCVCNAFKYIWRHRMKEGDEDIRKANWYLKKYENLKEKP